jgi:predicted RNA-binding protein with PUA-like domain
MSHWLLKTEPGSYGWADLVRDGGTEWDGVRNAAAALHLRTMREGDLAFLYHSGAEKAAVGIVRITRSARPDGAEGNWVSVAVAPVGALPRPVTLAAMKADPRLAGLPMLCQSRLSVSPIGEEEWAILIELAG